MGIIFSIRNHQYFGGARDHINAHLSKYAAFCGGNIGIAWASNLINRRDRLGPIRKGSDRLRTANAIHLIDTRDFTGQQNQRI